MVRWALTLLGSVHVLFGVPALVAPSWYFARFPGLGQHWTAAYPPYNEHLMTDVGAAFTTLGVLLLLAAWRMDRMVIEVVLIGVLLFSALHFGYHILDHGSLAGADLVLSLASLAVGVLAPLTLLVVNRRPPDATRPSGRSH